MRFIAFITFIVVCVVDIFGAVVDCVRLRYKSKPFRLGWGKRYPHNIKGMQRQRSGGASQRGAVR